MLTSGIAKERQSANLIGPLFANQTSH